MAVLKFLLTLVLIYFAIKMLYKAFVPPHIQQIVSAIRAASKQAGTQQAGSPQAQTQDEARPEGAVTVTNSKNDSPQAKGKSDTGEYIDYEEVK